MSEKRKGKRKRQTSAQKKMNVLILLRKKRGQKNGYQTKPRVQINYAHRIRSFMV